MKKEKVIYYVSTGILCLMMLGSAGMYIFQPEKAEVDFLKLGYPLYLMVPLAIAKTLGVIAIGYRKINILKNLAYAGFMYDFILAAYSHFAIGDPEGVAALVALLVLGTSYYFEQKLSAS